MITEKLQSQIQEALKKGESIRASTLRLLSTALHNEQIAKMRELTHDEEMVIIQRQVKQRNEAVEAYEKAGRTELAEKEKKEAEILQAFLPEQMSEEEVTKVVEEVIAEVGTADFGRVMGQVMGKLKGKADGNVVSRIVREKLQA